MGLNKARARRWYLPIGMAAAAIVASLFGDAGREWLSYFRPGLAQGEYWRLLTGHFAHLGVSHLVLNLAGLGLVWALVGESLTGPAWLVVTAASIAGIDIGLWFMDPQVTSYVGLSGLLHGLLAAGIVAALPARRVDTFVLAAVVLGKLVYEQLVGPLPGSEDASGGAVIVNAHAYGAVAGTIAGAIISIRVRMRAPI